MRETERLTFELAQVAIERVLNDLKSRVCITAADSRIFDEALSAYVDSDTDEDSDAEDVVTFEPDFDVRDADEEVGGHG